MKYLRNLVRCLNAFRWKFVDTELFEIFMDDYRFYAGAQWDESAFDRDRVAINKITDLRETI
jgi:hypothetical protein